MKKSIIWAVVALVLSSNAIAADPPVTGTGMGTVLTAREMPRQLFEPTILQIPEVSGLPFAGYPLQIFRVVPAEDTYYSFFAEDSSEEPGLRSATGGRYRLRLFVRDRTMIPDIERLYETHGYNKAVERNIEYFTGKARKSFGEHLIRSGRYIDLIVDLFTKKGLPVELVYLPLIESGFKTHAYSPKRAAGPWQFIPATAREHGMKIDWWVRGIANLDRVFFT